ncbi:MAG: neutral/alkaline non-lysosomal ceramidase N-terminal domain-containing protein [bacterium]
MSSIKIGFGVSRITPGLGVFMAGYFHERKATAIHDDLYAKAMIFDDGNVIAGILCCDLICLHKDEVAKIRDIVTMKTHMKGENLMICATHTHTGPQTRSFHIPEGGEVTKEWLAGFPDRAAKAVTDALNNMETCNISAGKSFEDRIAFNRRYRMKDGTVQTNPGYKNPDIIEPAGPIDPEVGVISFRNHDDKLIGLYVNYACHLDNVGGTEISADYPGYLTKRLQERLIDKPFVLYTNGACGDINHIDVRSPYRRSGHEHSRWMGETLAGDVCEALKNMEKFPADLVQTCSKNIQLPMKENADKEIGKVEIQAIRIGNIGFVGIPAEYFVEHQLDIKRRSPFKYTFVSELANGWVGYVPTKKAFEENMKDVPSEPMKEFDHKGYEVRSALSRGFLPGIGEVMADTAVELLNELNQ